MNKMLNTFSVALTMVAVEAIQLSLEDPLPPLEPPTLDCLTSGKIFAPFLIPFSL